MYLYSARLKMKNFYFKGKTYDQIIVNLFREDPENIRYPLKVYRELVENFDKIKNDKRDPMTLNMTWNYMREAVRELFTKEEIDAMKRYFEQLSDTKFDYRLKKPGSIAYNVMPWGAMPVGGPEDFICFNQMDNYPLRVKIWGHFYIDDDCQEIEDPEKFPQRLKFWASPTLERKAFNLSTKLIIESERRDK